MIQGINRLIRKLEQTQKALDQIMAETLQRNAALIEDYNVEQLNQGIDSEGRKIEPAYSPFTVQIKRLKGQPTGRVTLKDEGDFHRSMFLTGGFQGDFQIGNNDEKAPKLERKYGKDIFGLTDENKAKIAEEIKPEFIEAVRKYLRQ